LLRDRAKGPYRTATFSLSSIHGASLARLLRIVAIGGVDPLRQPPPSRDRVDKRRYREAAMSGMATLAACERNTYEYRRWDGSIAALVTMSRLK